MRENQNNSDPLIEVEGVSVAFGGKPVLEGVDVEICRGDFVAISGPNGGGKTTLLRVILGLLKPTSGHVRYFKEGKAVKKLAVGYLPQKSRIDLKFPISVEDAVKSGMCGGWLCRYPSDARERFEEVVELTGIRDYLDHQIGDLSGGQLQRALMARALISRPEVLILDEPLSYVDKNFERQIYSIMEDLSRKITIILVSHEMSVIGRMANRHLIVDHTVRECSGHCHYRAAECE